VGIAVLGIGMVAWAAGLSVWLAQRLRAAGRDTAPARRFLLHSAIGWAGVVLIVMSLNSAFGAALAVTLLVVCCVQVVRGVRRFPQVWRTLGDPDAWRGNGRA